VANASTYRNRVLIATSSAAVVVSQPLLAVENMRSTSRHQTPKLIIMRLRLRISRTSSWRRPTGRCSTALSTRLMGGLATLIQCPKIRHVSCSYMSSSLCISSSSSSLESTWKVVSSAANAIQRQTRLAFPLAPHQTREKVVHELLMVDLQHISVAQTELGHHQQCLQDVLHQTYYTGSLISIYRLAIEHQLVPVQGQTHVLSKSSNNFFKHAIMPDLDFLAVIFDHVVEEDSDILELWTGR